MGKKLAIVLALAGSSACAHKQLTNRQVAQGAAGVGVFGMLVGFWVWACVNDGPPVCSENPPVR
jgi:hypothetical protein